jgi:hypothetical protein
LQDLRLLIQSRLPAIYLLRDFHPYLDDPAIVRALREIAQDRRLLEKLSLIPSTRDLAC